MTDKKPTAAQRIKALTEGNKSVVAENNKINIKTEIVTDLRKFNKGGPGAGRPPSGQNLARRTLRAMLANHFSEEVEVELEDPKTHIIVKVKKPRVLAMMELMYQLAVKNGDSMAGDRWLNRALGKAPQPLIGDEEEDPIRVDLGVDRILGKIYDGDDEE